MAIWADITGLEEIKNTADKMANEQTHTQIMTDLLDMTVELMIRYAPVRTGELVHSIRWYQVGNERYAIIVDVPWAIYMEYGTRYFAVGTINQPKFRISSSGKSSYAPFMRPAIWEMMNLYPEYLRRALFFKIR